MAAAPLAVKKVEVKKVVNPLFEKRTKNYGIGEYSVGRRNEPRKCNCEEGFVCKSNVLLRAPFGNVTVVLFWRANRGKMNFCLKSGYFF